MYASATPLVAARSNHCTQAGSCGKSMAMNARLLAATCMT
jgi:hypothetical protein